jgi:hypothetical protein
LTLKNFGQIAATAAKELAERATPSMVICSAQTSEVNNGSAKSNSAVIFGIADSLDGIAFP